MNKIFSVLIILPLLASCSAPVSNLVSVQSAQQNQVEQKYNVVETNKQVIQPKIDNLTVITVSDKEGASFGANINLNSFGTKASTSGTPAKQPGDVAKVDVYLLKLPSGYNGTDPLGTANANVAKMSVDLAKTGSTFNVLFKNVPGLATNQYWVGIVAKDSGGNVIAKGPATVWTGQTATSASALSLSTSGVSVDPTTLAVNPTPDLTVNISLLDIVGAQISSNANVTGGSSTLPIISAQ